MSPRRTCIGCRAVDDQSAMVRLVRRGDLVVDGTRPRLDGRGAYLHPGCLVLAQRRQAIRRTFGANAELDAAVGPPSNSSGSAGRGAI